MNPRRRTNLTDRTLPFEELHCLHCGYPLAGLERSRCPECGEKFDAFDLRRLQKEPPRPYLYSSIVSMLVMPPFGIPAFYFSLQCREAMKRGEYGAAYRYSGKAASAGQLACGLFLILVFLAPVGIPIVLNLLEMFW